MDVPEGGHPHLVGLAVAVVWRLAADAAAAAADDDDGVLVAVFACRVHGPGPWRQLAAVSCRLLASAVGAWGPHH